MKRLLILFLFLIILGLGIRFSWLFFQLEEIVIIPLEEVKIEEADEDVPLIKKIFVPLPLRGPEKTEDPQVILIGQEIIKWTNSQREKYGLSVFEENAELNAMAKVKINDMFEKQYFAHESLTGEGVEDLAKEANYQFLIVGENLAMGNFLSNKDLVEAWMGSPGHRENILNQNYREIGAAAEKGIFNGRTVWLAVQHFGLSVTACPEPDKTIKLQIEKKQKEIKDLENLLFILEDELQRITPKWSDSYRQKVEEYNNLVEKYNNLLLENKALVSQYNIQVQEFNECIAGLK